MDEGARGWAEETVPILRVGDAAAAVRWYGRLGFVEEWTHRFGDGMPAFVSVRRARRGRGCASSCPSTPATPGPTG
jgi:Glyoxalase superfamily protein